MINDSMIWCEWSLPTDSVFAQRQWHWSLTIFVQWRTPGISLMTTWIPRMLWRLARPRLCDFMWFLYHFTGPFSIWPLYFSSSFRQKQQLIWLCLFSFVDRQDANVGEQQGVLCQPTAEDDEDVEAEREAASQPDNQATFVQNSQRPKVQISTFMFLVQCDAPRTKPSPARIGIMIRPDRPTWILLQGMEQVEHPPPALPGAEAGLDRQNWTNMLTDLRCCREWSSLSIQRHHHQCQQHQRCQHQRQGFSQLNWVWTWIQHVKPTSDWLTDGRYLSLSLHLSAPPFDLMLGQSRAASHDIFIQKNQIQIKISLNRVKGHLIQTFEFECDP